MPADAHLLAARCVARSPLWREGALRCGNCSFKSVRVALSSLSRAAIALSSRVIRCGGRSGQAWRSR